MSQILSVAIKDLRLMSRDKLGMFFIIGFPLLMGTFFGMITGSMRGGDGGVKMTIAIADQDQSDISKLFISGLEANKSISTVALEREEAMDAVRRGKYTGMIVIPEGFGETAGVLWANPPEVELGIDPSRSAEAGMLQGLVMQAVGGLVSERFQDVDSMRSIVDSTRESIKSDAEMGVAQRLAVTAIMNSLDGLFDTVSDAQADDDANSMGTAMPGMQLANVKSLDVTRRVDPKSTAALVKKIRSEWDISFPQATVWGILACVAGFAVLTVRERALGTLVRLQVSPVPSWAILCGKGLACFLAVLFCVAVMSVVGYFLGMRPKRWDYLALAAVCTGLCFSGLMMLVSTFGKSEQSVSGAIWGLNMLMAMFGGGMIPVAFMPKFMKPLSSLTPVKWSVLSLEGAIWREFSLAEMMLPCGILIAIGVVSSAVGSYLLTRQLSAR